MIVRIIHGFMLLVEQSGAGEAVCSGELFPCGPLGSEAPDLALARCSACLGLKGCTPQNTPILVVVRQLPWAMLALGAAMLWVHGLGLYPECFYPGSESGVG